MEFVVTHINEKVFSVNGIGKRFGINRNTDSFFILYWLTRFPSNLIVTAVTKTRMDLTWTNNGIADYSGAYIERSDDGINYSVIGDLAPGSSSFSDLTCVDGVIYYYRLRYYKN
jgi:hypothetical protein